MDTIRKKNVSGVDLEVAVLDFGVVKNGAEVDLPTHYPWHTEGDPAPIVWPDALWEDVSAAKPDKPKTDTTTTTKPGE